MKYLSFLSELKIETVCIQSIIIVFGKYEVIIFIIKRFLFQVYLDVGLRPNSSTTGPSPRTALKTCRRRDLRVGPKSWVVIMRIRIRSVRCFTFV